MQASAARKSIARSTEAAPRSFVGHCILKAATPKRRTAASGVPLELLNFNQLTDGSNLYTASHCAILAAGLSKETPLHPCLYPTERLPLDYSTCHARNVQASEQGKSAWSTVDPLQGFGSKFVHLGCMLAPICRIGESWKSCNQSTSSRKRSFFDFLRGVHAVCCRLLRS